MYIIKRKSAKGNYYYKLVVSGFKDEKGNKTKQYVVINNYDYATLKTAGVKEYEDTAKDSEENAQ